MEIFDYATEPVTNDALRGQKRAIHRGIMLFNWSYRFHLNRCFYTAKILLPGLVTAQIIATIQVYLSNTEFFHTLVSIRNAGYLLIPNQQVMQGLLELKPAFYGGLFFTLSVGAGLSVLTLAAAWIWECLFSRKKILLLLFLVPWTGLIVGINVKDFCPIITSYFLFIPPIVFFLDVNPNAAVDLTLVKQDNFLVFKHDGLVKSRPRFIRLL
jgi:hypothetical protein